MKSPISNNIRNPLKKKDTGKLKNFHKKQLGEAGVKPPKSPI